MTNNREENPVGVRRWGDVIYCLMDFVILLFIFFYLVGVWEGEGETEKSVVGEQGEYKKWKSERRCGSFSECCYIMCG